jgi:hypothetical protein
METCAKDKDCGSPRDNLIVHRITQCILPPKRSEEEEEEEEEEGETWPIERSEGISLRTLLHGLRRLERIQRIAWCNIHGERMYGSVGLEDFERICTRVDEVFVTGVCLGCTRSGRECDCEADSVPHAGSLRFVSRDSYLLGAGPTYEDESEDGSTGVEGSPGMDDSV